LGAKILQNKLLDRTFWLFLFALTILAAGFSTGCTAGLTGSTKQASGAPSQGAPPTQPSRSQLAMSPSTLNFGDVAVGSTTALDVTLSNTGHSNVSVSQSGISGAGFQSSGVGSGLTLTPGQSANLEVDFDPAGAGSVTGVVTLSTDGGGAPISISLSGNGVDAAHSVTLNWTPDPGVSGFNAYRGSAPGGPFTKLNPAPIALLSFTDATALGGQVYYYAVSALEGGVESALSDPVPVTVPSP
jgi:hypothetical protein